MDYNIIKKIFPTTNNYQELKYDTEGLWSITLPKEAIIITSIIKSVLNSESILFDGTGGLGGNAISFCQSFKFVTICEINNERFQLLENNLNTFDVSNVNLINDSCLNHLNGSYDGYFFDPPWGGPEYKLNDKTTIKLDNLNLVDLVQKIRTKSASPIFFKLPSNYNLDEFNIFNYKIDKIKKYFLVSIY